MIWVRSSTSSTWETYLDNSSFPSYSTEPAKDLDYPYTLPNSPTASLPLSRLSPQSVFLLNEEGNLISSPTEEKVLLQVSESLFHRLISWEPILWHVSPQTQAR